MTFCLPLRLFLGFRFHVFLTTMKTPCGHWAHVRTNRICSAIFPLNGAVEVLELAQLGRLVGSPRPPKTPKCLPDLFDKLCNCAVRQVCQGRLAISSCFGLELGFSHMRHACFVGAVSWDNGQHMQSDERGRLLPRDAPSNKLS